MTAKKIKAKPKPAGPQHGDLRVWWIPQIPGKSFHVPVANLCEAKLLLDALANYDIWQFEHNIKPDYCNAGGLQVFDSNLDDGGDWVDWYDDEGEDIDKRTLQELRMPKWEGNT